MGAEKMIIDTDRAELDTALKDSANAILLVFGENNPTAEGIHKKAIEVAAKYDKPFLLKKLSVLTAIEKVEWYKDDQKFTLLSPLKPGYPKRKVVEQSPLDDLLTSTGQASSRKIQAAWGRAENG